MWSHNLEIGGLTGWDLDYAAGRKLRPQGVSEGGLSGWRGDAFRRMVETVGAVASKGGGLIVVRLDRHGGTAGRDQGEQANSVGANVGFHRIKGNGGGELEVEGGVQSVLDLGKNCAAFLAGMTLAKFLEPGALSNT